MTVKLTVLYTPPADAEAFEEHYNGVHRGLVAAMPGLERAEYALVVNAPGAPPAPYHRSAELYFPDVGTLGAALGSPAGAAAAEDAADLTKRTGATSTFLVATVD